MCVPNPAGPGTVKATVITPAPAKSPVRFAWVRIEEGPEAGTNFRVGYQHIKYAT